MANGGDIDRSALVESFSKIKQDISRLNDEMLDLRTENNELREQYLKLRDSQMSSELISSIVEETISKFQTKESPLVKKINKNKKRLIFARIQEMASLKNKNLAEIKDIVVDMEGLCSKATFYRYAEKLKKKGLIEVVKVDEIEIVITNRF